MFDVAVDQPSRITPRMSVNKLGEYLHASPGRRRRILQDQRRPPRVAVIRYTEAENAIAESIARRFDPEPLDIATRKLSGTTPKSASDATRIKCCLEAMSKYRKMDIASPLLGATAHRPSEPARHLCVKGLDISVRPELVVVRSDGREARVGLVKLHFPKSHPLDDLAASLVGAIATKYADERLASLGRVDHRLVLVVDVGSGRVHIAPRAVTRALKDVEAGCEEIVALWRTV